MTRFVAFLFAALVFLSPIAPAWTPAPAAAPTATETVALRPPVAKAVPTRLEKHGQVRIDPYYWLKERENPEVLNYLKAENAYTDAVLAPVQGLQDSLFREIVGRIQKTDMSVPYRLGNYLYYTRYEGETDYPLFCRKRAAPNAPEETLLDVNALARGHAFYAARGVAVSSGEDFLAFAADSVGRRLYTLEFKNLVTGEILPDAVPGITSNLAWAEDNRTLFYTKQDPVTLRWYRVYRHVLGTDPGTDALVYEEPDETFEVSVSKSKSRKFIFIASTQTLSSEVRYIPAAQPAADWIVVLPRERNHEYDVDHFGDHFYLRTNDEAKNFRLVRTPIGATDRKYWDEVIPHRKDVLLEGFEIFKDYLVAVEREDGLPRFRVRAWASRHGHDVSFGEPAYYADLDTNLEFDTPVLRFVYTSLTTPKSVYDYDMRTRKRILLKQEEVVGNFDPKNYRTERLRAPARDGVRVPISVVYRRGTPLDGSAPLLLYGYGSYGYSEEAEFSSPLLSLLDRGFVYAIAHVRGGSELGRQWYEDGKLMKKTNSFTDFIDSAHFLIRKRMADPGRVFALGGSAGGLLMGAVTNMEPGLWRGVVAEVPFVDVVTTMLDPGIPLTTSEYDEWGNPEDRASYDFMLGYSPYDNVEAKAYPNLLVTTGLHDSQVQYWEPAKWVAKLRSLKTDDHMLLLKTNMEAGHGGASGRLKRHRETALIWSFFLDLAGLAGRPARLP